MKSMAASAKPRLIITKGEDGSYTVVTWTLMHESSITFKLDEEFDELRLDGITVKSIVTRDGNTFTQVSKGDDKEITVVREFSAEGLKVVASINDVTSTRFYKRVEDSDPGNGGNEFD